MGRRVRLAVAARKPEAGHKEQGHNRAEERLRAERRDNPAEEQDKLQERLRHPASEQATAGVAPVAGATGAPPDAAASAAATRSSIPGVPVPDTAEEPPTTPGAAVPWVCCIAFASIICLALA
jgi:hypothetical protein